MTLAAAAGAKTISAGAAAAFALLVIAAALHINAPLWRGRQANAAAPSPVEALRQTTWFTIFIYIWAAAALYLIYGLSGIWWRHGWQYATAMLLMAAGHALYNRWAARNTFGLAEPAAVHGAVALAALQGSAMAATLWWVITTGKLDTVKGDWAANHVFLAGGTAIVCLTLIILKTHMALSQRHA